MPATKEIDTILASQGLPMELLRLASSHHAGDEPRVASMVSGIMAARHQDEVICPLMLQRNLVVPAHEGAMPRDGWRVD
jgi:hypothetical protein